jgi:hypothetical protein
MHKSFQQPVIPTTATVPNSSDSKIEDVFSVFIRPEIVMQGFETAPIPDTVKNAIFIERLILAKDDVKTASETETMWYLSTVSLAMPLNGSWSKIYTHLFERYRKNVLEKSPSFAADETSLMPHEDRELKKLRDWLYKKSTEAVSTSTKKPSALYFS